MNRLINWFFDLGEKSSRTDIWVMLITITYLGCIFRLVECQENPIITTILIAMFADLGITSILKHRKNDNNQ